MANILGGQTRTLIALAAGALLMRGYMTSADLLAFVKDIEGIAGALGYLAAATWSASAKATGPQVIITDGTK